MEGQLTIWDWTGTADDELTTSIRHTMYEGGNIRIYALFNHERDARKRARFICKEYGVGGRSIVTNKGRGFVDFNSKGVHVSSWEDDQKSTYSWKEAENRIRELIEKGDYLSEKDRKKWEGLTERPYPTPCYRYPQDAHDSEEDDE